MGNVMRRTIWAVYVRRGVEQDFNKADRGYGGGRQGHEAKTNGEGDAKPGSALNTQAMSGKFTHDDHYQSGQWIYKLCSLILITVELC